jgi:hypothetical protein
MAPMYDEIMSFMNEYFPAYSQYGQVAETHRVMDKFYAPELSFPADGVTSREQWYKRCLAHPTVQDRLSLEHLYIDEKQNEVGALLKTQAVDRATGKVLLELKLNAFYRIKRDTDKAIKITQVRVFVESDPDKLAKLNQLYQIGK